MKSIHIVICFLLLSIAPYTVYAIPGPGIPKFDFGIQAGANFGKLQGDAWQQNMQPGFTGGLFLGVRMKKIGVQAEAMITGYKYSTTSTVGLGDFSSTNLEIPVLLQYKLFPYFWLQVGPQYSAYLTKNEIGNPSSASIFNNTFSGVIGLEIKTPLKFNIGVRYILGLTDVNNVSNDLPGAWQQRSVQVHLGFRFM
jgi:hypothetical protein